MDTWYHSGQYISGTEDKSIKQMSEQWTRYAAHPQGLASLPIALYGEGGVIEAIIVMGNHR